MEKTITIAICDDEKAIRDEISECIRDIVSDATISPKNIFFNPLKIKVE